MEKRRESTRMSVDVRIIIAGITPSQMHEESVLNPRSCGHNTYQFLSVLSAETVMGVSVRVGALRSGERLSLADVLVGVVRLGSGSVEGGVGGIGPVCLLLLELLNVTADDDAAIFANVVSITVGKRSGGGNSQRCHKSEKTM
jgi:hypothetical protein